MNFSNNPQIFRNVGKEKYNRIIKDYILQTIPILQPYIIFLLGSVGVGKTNFVKKIGELLSINPKTITSPTFNIVNEYEHAKGRLIHFDLYRLNKIEDVLKYGFDDYIQSLSDGDLLIIEWPDLVSKNLYEMNFFVTKIIIDFEKDKSKRKINIEYFFKK